VARKKREIGEWRCSACGDATEVYACAVAIVFGRIDGPELVTEDDTEQTELCAGSEECRVHQNTEPLERWNGKRWVRWQDCPECEGTGRRRNPYNVRVEIPCRRCFALGGWWPGITKNPGGLEAAAPTPQSTTSEGGR
jgi:hypothetical protein